MTTNLPVVRLPYIVADTYGNFSDDIYVSVVSVAPTVTILAYGCAPGTENTDPNATDGCYPPTSSLTWQGSWAQATAPPSSSGFLNGNASISDYVDSSDDDDFQNASSTPTYGTGFVVVQCPVTSKSVIHQCTNTEYVTWPNSTSQTKTVVQVADLSLQPVDFTITAGAEKFTGTTLGTATTTRTSGSPSGTSTAARTTSTAGTSSSGSLTTAPPSLSSSASTTSSSLSKSTSSTSTSASAAASSGAAGPVMAIGNIGLLTLLVSYLLR